MVSSAVDMELDELLANLERMRREYAGDAEYEEARGQLPAEWPM